MSKPRGRKSAASTAMIVLETERLVLRTWESADFEAYAEMCADPKVVSFRQSCVGPRGGYFFVARMRRTDVRAI